MRIALPGHPDSDRAIEVLFPEGRSELVNGGLKRQASSGQVAFTLPDASAYLLYSQRLTSILLSSFGLRQSCEIRESLRGERCNLGASNEYDHKHSASSGRHDRGHRRANCSQRRKRGAAPTRVRPARERTSADII